MCGELKWRRHHFHINSPIPVKTSRFEGELPWTGFARVEKLKFWKQKAEGTLASIKAEEFAEGPRGLLHRIPEGYEMKGLIVNKDIEDLDIYTGDVKILTRPALTPYEIKTHPRFPYVVKKDADGFSIKIWTQANE